MQITDAPPRAASRHRSLRQLAEIGAEVLISRWKLRRCTKIGPRARVQGKVLIECGRTGSIELGERVRIRGTHVPVELAALPKGRLIIGARSFINSGTSICAAELIQIGENCAIGNYTLIMDTDFHDATDHSLPGKTKPVIIEDDVWLAARVTILKGVHIGKGAVVAAGAVVTHDVPAGTIVGGVPARVLRMPQVTPTVQDTTTL